MNGEEAIAWVDSYRCLVDERIRKFMTNSPYEMKDYLQDAYEAALLAAAVSNRKGLSFSSVFWLTFKRNALRVSPCIDAKKDSNVSTSVCDCQGYCDDVYYGGEGYLPSPEEPLLNMIETEEAEEEILSHLFDRLMPVEKKVLTCICGLHGERMSYAETALFLGMSEGAVSQTFRRILKKALLFRADYERSDCSLERCMNREELLNQTAGDTGYVFRSGTNHLSGEE